MDETRVVAAHVSTHKSIFPLNNNFTSHNPLHFCKSKATVEICMALLSALLFLPKQPAPSTCGGLSFSKTITRSNDVAQKHLHRGIMVVRGWGVYKMCSLLPETWYPTPHFACPKLKTSRDWDITLPSAFPKPPWIPKDVAVSASPKTRIRRHISKKSTFTFILCLARLSVGSV